ncbi:hypothetical protein VP01_2047g1 [Puccinia sorghi]|uniref:Uncharacterized protein n=1 Tax=Puccinia sorghi TaxID=27349 RepID=A0A0L6VAT7_9BASI|nr:hypothetical protein VP01_2047g1 [Puccinia sorghi]
MIATSVNYTAQSVALHQLVVKVMKLDPPESVPLILSSTACLEPFAGFLYVLSSIPAIRQEGFWLMKMEKNGLIRPNIRTLIPMFVLVYIGLSMATIHCFQNDLRKSIVSTVTVALSLTTCPFLLCTGWTKSKLCYFKLCERGHFTNLACCVLLCHRQKPTVVWNVLTLIPRHKAGIAMRQLNSDSTLTYFQPRTLNILSAFFYASPFVFSGPITYLLTREVVDLNHRFRDYDHNFSTIMTGKLKPETVLKLNIKAITQLAYMRQRGDKMLFLCRVYSFGYFLFILVLLCLMLFGYHRILQTVRYPIRVFHQAVKQQAPVTLSVVSLSDNSALKTKMNSTSLDTSCDDTTILKRRRKTFKPVLQFSSWLPVFRQDPDFIPKPCASPTSDNLYLDNSQIWERNNQATIYSQCNALKKYQSHRDECVSNYLEVPKRRTLSELSWFTVCMGNAIWVGTMGIPFGLVTVLVAFSSPITAVREKAVVGDEFDY